MKKRNELVLLIGSFLLVTAAQANTEQIKMNCEAMAQKMCGENCVEPEAPGTGDYPEWWSQAMKNKEWNKRVELKKKAKIYQDALSSQEPYIKYCIAKEEDVRKIQTVDKMVHREYIAHENIFLNWNQLRLNELKSHILTFNVIEKDREIYNKRYTYYKRNTYQKVKKSLSGFVQEDIKEKRLSLLEARHKNVELQNEFLSFLAADLNNFNSYFDVSSKVKSQEQRVSIVKDHKDLETLEISENEDKALNKYLVLIKRFNDKQILKYYERLNIKVIKYDE